MTKGAQLLPMAGHFLYESMSPAEQRYYKPCSHPHGPSCQVFLKDNLPHYWLNYDERTHRPTPYEPMKLPDNFKELII